MRRRQLRGIAGLLRPYRGRTLVMILSLVVDESRHRIAVSTYSGDVLVFDGAVVDPEDAAVFGGAQGGRLGSVPDPGGGLVSGRHARSGRRGADFRARVRNGRGERICTRQIKAPSHVAGGGSAFTNKRVKG